MSILLTISFFLMEEGENGNKSHRNLVSSFQQTNKSRTGSYTQLKKMVKGHVKESNLKIIVWTGRRDVKDQFTKSKDFLPK